jgi:hypothetical protein
MLFCILAFLPFSLNIERNLSIEYLFMQKVGFSFLVFFFVGLFGNDGILQWEEGSHSKNSMLIINKRTHPRICEYFGKRFSSS